MTAPTPVPITTTTSAPAHRPDTYTYAIEDAIPDVAILRHSIVSGTVGLGDANVTRVAYFADVDEDDVDVVNELDLIPELDADANDVVVISRRISFRTLVSREQFALVNTAASLATSVSRTMLRRSNKAFLVEAAPTSPAIAPVAGILNQTGIVSITAVADLDPIITLLAQLQENLARPDGIVVSPSAWAKLRLIKTFVAVGDAGSTSQENVLGAGATDSQPMLLGLPVSVINEMPANTGAIVSSTDIPSVVSGLEISTSEHGDAFDRNGVMIRANMRQGHALVHPNRLGKFVMS